jgi:hypothetical protein
VEPRDLEQGPPQSRRGVRLGDVAVPLAELLVPLALDFDADFGLGVGVVDLQAAYEDVVFDKRRAADVVPRILKP